MGLFIPTKQEVYLNISRTLVPTLNYTGPSGHTVSDVGLRPPFCWDCGFDSRRRHGCLSVVSVVCCQVEVHASDASLVQKSPRECGGVSV